MRDIRKDIRERIEAIQSYQEHLRFRLTELDKRAAALEDFLKQEEIEWKAKQQPTLFSLGETSREVKLRSELSRFLLDVLKDGNPHSTVELADLAVNRGVPIKGKSPLRAIHFSLVGMKNNNLVERVEPRVWRMHKDESGETPS